VLFMTLILFSAVWVIGGFVSFLAINIGLLHLSGRQELVWTEQSMLNSLVALV
jgi:hypothetical protein